MGQLSTGQQFAVVVLYIIHGFLLWILVPLGFIAWVFAIPLHLRRPIRLGEFLGWLDINMVAFLQRAIFGPLFQDPVKWLTPREMRGLTYRISYLDFM